ncbi:fructose-bisphosphate aldolase 6, cytosolic [Tanacetum coccineum]
MSRMWRALRELLFGTPGALQYLSGVILFEETLYQKTAAGTIGKKLASEEAEASVEKAGRVHVSDSDKLRSFINSYALGTRVIKGD